MKALMTIAVAAALASATVPAEAAFVGVPTGHHAAVMSSIARTQQRNNAAIAHVRNSIASTRRNKL